MESPDAHDAVLAAGGGLPLGSVGAPPATFSIRFAHMDGGRRRDFVFEHPVLRRTYRKYGADGSLTLSEGRFILTHRDSGWILMDVPLLPLRIRRRSTLAVRTFSAMWLWPSDGSFLAINGVSLVDGPVPRPAIRAGRARVDAADRLGRLLLLHGAEEERPPGRG